MKLTFDDYCQACIHLKHKSICDRQETCRLAWHAGFTRGAAVRDDLACAAQHHKRETQKKIEFIITEMEVSLGPETDRHLRECVADWMERLRALQ